MDINKTLKELKDERDRLDQTIRDLEGYGLRTPRKRGRPPKWLSEARAKGEKLSKPRSK